MTREDDKRVAEIMGWKKIKPVPGFPSELSGAHPRGNMTTGVPRFTSDPAADYTVLEWVRNANNISLKSFSSYIDILCDLLETDREGNLGNFGFMGYLPGDYSRALLELDKKGAVK